MLKEKHQQITHHLSLNGFIFQPEDVGYSFVCYFAFHYVQSLRQSRVVLAGLSPAFACQGYGVGQGGICQCHGGGEGYGAGDIGNGVVYNSVHNVGRVAVREIGRASCRERV